MASPEEADAARLAFANEVAAFERLAEALASTQPAPAPQPRLVMEALPQASLRPQPPATRPPSALMALAAEPPPAPANRTTPAETAAPRPSSALPRGARARSPKSPPDEPRRRPRLHTQRGATASSATQQVAMEGSGAHDPRAGFHHWQQEISGRLEVA